MKILKKYTILVGVGSLIALFYIHFIHNSHEYRLFLHQAKHRAISQGFSQDISQSISQGYQIHQTNKICPVKCINVLERMIAGRWVKKHNVTQKDVERRELMGIAIRNRRGFPTYLTRNDQHCGPNYPLSTGSKITLDIPAACDVLGQKHCCNPDTGQCGLDEISCKCDNCTDFSDVFHAQFADWLPNDNNCHVKYFTQTEACDMLSRHVSAMTFLGDSIVRHFHCAMMLLLTGDEARGALKQGITEEERILCEGEWQFVDAGTGLCPLKIARRNTEVENGKFCFGKSNFMYHFNESYSVKYADMALSAVNELLGRKNSIVVLGIGAHDKYNASFVIEDYLGPIVRLVKNKGNGWPSLIWLGIHSNGFHKPVKYLQTQGMHKIIPYNRIMKEYCKVNGIAFFDSIQLTQRVHSYDGTHYDKTVNLLKVHVLLNYLEEKFKCLK